MKLSDTDSGSYTHEDGSPDSIDDIITSCRCFAVALGHLLRENEGICIELPFQSKYPEDRHGKFVVYSAGGMVRIQDAALLESSEDLTSGRMLWFHNDNTH